MISQYYGHYRYDKFNISSCAPDAIGVYYCGYIDSSGNLAVLYVGKASGIFSKIKDRLLDHLREENWFDITHFGYRTCSSSSEAEKLELDEIRRLQPKYNSVGKAVGW